MQHLHIRVKQSLQSSKEGNQKKEWEGSGYLLKPKQLHLQSKITFNQGPFKSPYSAFVREVWLDVCSVKGLNKGTNTIKQESCKITIKSNSVTVTGWFMTELTRQKKRQMTRKQVCVFEWDKARQKEWDMETKERKGGFAVKHLI